MSAAFSPTPSPPAPSPSVRAPTEAFGQTGVRQYFSSFVALLLAVVTAGSIAMWFRSHRTNDLIEVEHPYGRTLVSSAWGRILVRWQPSQAQSEWAWYYNARPFRPRGADPWESSIWKLVGIEWRAQPPNPAGQRAWWLRIRWPTIMLLASIYPLWHSIRQTRQARAAARVDPSVQRYCGRCGRSVDPQSPTCGHCGRRLIG